MTDPHTPNRRYATMVVAAISIVALSCVAFLVPVPYVTMKPGPAFNTLGKFDNKKMIDFGSDVKTYQTSGVLDFTTVSVSRASRHVSIFEALRSYFDGQNAVVPRSLVYPDQETQDQSTAEGAEQLASSKDTSRAAALRAAGYDVTQVPAVKSVLKNGSSAGKLRAGDEIIAVNGKKPKDYQAIVDTVSSLKPGDSVDITVSRDDKKRTFPITTKPDPKEKDVARIGVTIGSEFHYPIKVVNNVGAEIGGPSAGTMFALAIYDKLTPRSLTGGNHVAGTGVITGEGKVLPIGGVRQKMAGASAAGAKIFLVPTSNCTEAAAGDNLGLKLVRITTLKSAISAISKLAKDSKAKVPTCN